MDKLIHIDDYFKNIRFSDTTHIYLEQDFGYDEYGNINLLPCYKVRIIKDEKHVFSRDIGFTDFKYCENLALSICNELNINPEFVITNIHRRDEKVRIKTIV